jgi:hypothetical protein
LQVLWWDIAVNLSSVDQPMQSLLFLIVSFLQVLWWDIAVNLSSVDQPMQDFAN